MTVKQTKGFWEKFDPSQSGLKKFLNDYEELILNYVWHVGDYGVDSASTMRVVNERLQPKESISKATVIHYLNKMVDLSILDVRDATGKGGHRNIYYPKIYEKGFIKYVLETLFQSMLGDFPEETQEIINGLTQVRALSELQESYEELQSTHEELERTKDELQATNEDLITLNEELWRSDDEKRAILGAIPDFITLKDTDYRFIWVNEALARDLSLTVDEVVDRICYELVYDRDEPCEGCPVRKTLETGQRVREIVTFPTGRVYNSVVEPIYDESGDIIATVELSRDVTESRRMEEEIQSLARFPSENTSPVGRISEDGIIMYANAAFKPLLEEWGVEIGNHAPEEWRHHISDVLVTGVKEIEVHHEDIMYSFSFVPVTDAGYVNVYGRIITERALASV